MTPAEMDELVRQVKHSMWQAVPAGERTVSFWGHLDVIARGAIDAVRAFQAEHGAWSAAEMNADWWVEGPRDGEV